MSLSILNLPGPFADAMLVLLRVAGFGVVVVGFVATVVPVSGLIALMAAVLIFTVPLLVPEAPTIEQFVGLDGGGGASITAVQLVGHLGYGMILGAVGSSVIAVTVLVSRWMNGLVLEAEPSFGMSFQFISRGFERSLLLLVLLTAIPFLPQAFQFFVESFAQLPLHASGISLSVAAWKVVLASGQMAFSLSMLMLFPMFVVLVLGSACLIVLEKLFPHLMFSGLSRALLIPLMLLAFAYGMNRLFLFEEESAKELLQFERQRSVIEVQAIGQ